MSAADSATANVPVVPSEDATPHPPGEPFLRTRRITLVDLRHEQVMDLLRLGLDSRVAAHILDAPLNTLREIVGLIEHARRIALERPGLGFWYATGGRGEFIGIFSLVPSTEIGEVEIGTRLLPRTWGRGYALEGGAALCDHAFNRLGLPKLIGLCTPDNRSVPPLLQRLGFLPDGRTTQFDREALKFALQRQHWSGLRSRRLTVK